MKIAFGIAVVRGLISVVFSLALVLAPEQLMPGSSAEPARTLAVFFASRLFAIGAAFIALAVLKQTRALAGLFFADVALQGFDLLWPLAHGQTNGFVAPLVIGATGIWAGLRLRRG